MPAPFALPFFSFVVQYPQEVIPMKRTAIIPQLSQFPREFHTLLTGCPVFDSSCSAEARVYYLDREGGLFLKSAPGGTLKTEAAMTAYYHSKGLSAEVLCYLPGPTDWLLTRAIPGEDCTNPRYLEDPKRLCDTTATLLRQLHETSFSGCPVINRNESYIATATKNHAAGKYDAALFPDNWGFSGAEEAWQEIRRNGRFLTADTLLHGDYCLPNVLLNDWRFSGFIDVGNGGVGDRHIDLFWGAWTLLFNLKTDAYCSRFLDCYGRDKVEPQKLRTIAAFEVFG